MQGRERVELQLLDAGALVGHLVPAGSMFAFLAAHRQDSFGDEDFADLFPSGRGRPSIPARPVIGLGDPGRAKPSARRSTDGQDGRHSGTRHPASLGDEQDRRRPWLPVWLPAIS